MGQWKKPRTEYGARQNTKREEGNLNRDSEILQGLGVFYGDAGSMGSKQRESVIPVQKNKCDKTEIIQIWWDDTHDWHTVLECCNLFKKNRLNRNGAKATLYIKKHPCTENLESEDGYHVESISACIKRRQKQK